MDVAVMLTALPLVEAAAVRKVVGFMVMTIPRIAVQRGSVMLDEAIAVNQRGDWRRRCCAAPPRGK